MIRFPNCKINIGLYITNKRSDGYHNLETVFFPIGVHDALEIIPAETTDLHLYGKAVAGDKENNLTWRAFKLLYDTYPGKVQPVNIHLLKCIPMGAGLGGGSADGAYMLQLLNDNNKLGATKEQLAELALQLGSDCSFFIYNTPQFATGRGEKMEPIALDLSRYSIQLICPQVHVSTAEAFKMITPQKAPFDLRKLNELPINLWKEYISNDFEIPVFQKHPQIKELVDQLYIQGAIYASMTGSGSAVYGIFEKGKKATINTALSTEVFYLQ